MMLLIIGKFPDNIISGAKTCNGFSRTAAYLLSVTFEENIVFSYEAKLWLLGFAGFPEPTLFFRLVINWISDIIYVHLLSGLVLIIYIYFNILMLSNWNILSNYRRFMWHLSQYNFIIFTLKMQSLYVFLLTCIKQICKIKYTWK